MAIDYALRAAVLINSGDFLVDKVRESFTTSLDIISSSIRIDFYDPIVEQFYPDVAAYDLVILGGGTTDLTVTDVPPWVLKLQGFIRSTVTRFPDKKILGICWGHQVIARTFGGKIRYMLQGEVGVHTVPLTKSGSDFFSNVHPNTSGIEIMQFHGRDVETAAKGFIPLAEGNQCFVNVGNTILTFQGHPEVGAEFAKAILENKPAYIRTDYASSEALLPLMEKRTDGMAIWKRIVSWVAEPSIQIVEG